MVDNEKTFTIVCNEQNVAINPVIDNSPLMMLPVDQRRVMNEQARMLRIQDFHTSQIQRAKLIKQC